MGIFNIIWEILDSDFLGSLIGAILLVVGGSALGIYKKQRSDQKKDSAKLILQEIRYAEDRIRNARATGISYYLADKLLPANSWYRNIHLFVGDLRESEIDLINRFYSHCEYLDAIIKKISDYKNRHIIQAEKQAHPKPAQQIEPSEQFTGQGQESTGQQFTQQTEQREIQFVAVGAQNLLRDVSEKIELIYNSPAVQKLRLISGL